MLITFSEFISLLSIAFITQFPVKRNLPVGFPKRHGLALKIPKMHLILL